MEWLPYEVGLQTPSSLILSYLRPVQYNRHGATTVLPYVRGVSEPLKCILAH
jgi:hypothetical protein